MIKDLSERFSTDTDVGSASYSDPEVYKAALTIMERDQGGSSRTTGKESPSR